MSLTYPLQMAPIRKIPQEHLDTLDVTIRQSAKGAIGLPVHSPNAMMYSTQKYRGLGLVCARNEVRLQHFSVAKKLTAVDDELFHEVYDCEKEMDECRSAPQVEKNATKELRQAIREDIAKLFVKQIPIRFGFTLSQLQTPSNVKFLNDQWCILTLDYSKTKIILKILTLRLEYLEAK